MQLCIKESLEITKEEICARIVSPDTNEVRVKLRALLGQPQLRTVIEVLSIHITIKHTVAAFLIA